VTVVELAFGPLGVELVELLLQAAIAQSIATAPAQRKTISFISPSVSTQRLKKPVKNGLEPAPSLQPR
jgi:hypothetical protein